MRKSTVLDAAADASVQICATAVIVLLVLAFRFDRPHVGNEFGPLAEIVILYPIGIALWFVGLLLLWRAYTCGEPLGRLRVILQSVNGLFYIGPPVVIVCAFLFPPTEYVYEISCELRVSASVQIEPLTRFSLTTDTDRSGGTLEKAARRKIENQSVIFSTASLLNAHKEQRVFYVQRPNGPYQVFHLPADPPQPTDWTQWRSPDWVEKRENDWHILADSQNHERSAKVPPDCFELRYRIDKFESKQWTTNMMERDKRRQAQKGA